VDADTFLARFPEFRTATNIEEKLAEATRRTAPETFGELTEDAIGYMAAHLIAISPQGISQRLEDDKSETTYLKEWRAILRQKAIRMLVT
jgi:gamma-glutamylcysteine synthetase